MGFKAHKQIGQWIIAGGLGLAAALSFFNHLIQPHVTALLDITILLIYLTGLLTALAYVLVFRWTLPRLQLFSPHAKVAWATIALVGATLMVLALPIAAPWSQAPHSLEIVATGQKNPLAKGSEVWIIGLYHADGSQIPAEEITLQGAWEIRDGKWLSSQSQPSTLRWQGNLDGDLQARFISHPWSGIIKMSLDGDEQATDLYADTGTTKVVTLRADSAHLVNTRARSRSALIVGADAVTLALMLFMASAWLVTRPTKLGRFTPARWTRG